VHRKIAVIGSSCSGKSTLAGELARRHGVPHVELDALNHGPSWQEATAEELRTKVEAALAGTDGWVTCGNYMTKLGTWLVDQADTIVWLDLPLRTLLARMWRRTRGRIGTGEELWESGNRESWRNFLVGRDSLLWFTVRHYHRRRREWPARLEGRNLIRLRSPEEIRKWLEAVPSARPPKAEGVG
jgi:adenylate kinase family enzyme